MGLFILCLPWLVESPWYYARKHLDDKAKDAMKKLHGRVKGYDIDHEYRVMQVELEHEEALRRSSGDSAFKEIFIGHNLRRTLSSFFGVVMLQWSGASVVFSYATCK